MLTVQCLSGRASGPLQALLLGAIVMSAAQAQAPVPPQAPTATAVAATAVDPADVANARRNWEMRAGQLVRRTWGVEVLGVRLASHDWMLQFKYRVVDPEKSKPLLDRHSVAYLVDETSGARLAVPAMENIGDLRQSTTPEANRVYFMNFGNANQIVRHGSKVDVVIGGFHAEGLVVD